MRYVKRPVERWLPGGCRGRRPGPEQRPGSRVNVSPAHTTRQPARREANKLLRPTRASPSGSAASTVPVDRRRAAAHMRPPRPTTAGAKSISVAGRRRGDRIGARRPRATVAAPPSGARSANPSARPRPCSPTSATSPGAPRSAPPPTRSPACRTLAVFPSLIRRSRRRRGRVAAPPCSSTSTTSTDQRLFRSPGGDDALAAAGAALRARSGRAIFAGHYGGEEFLVRSRTRRSKGAILTPRRSCATRSSS